MKQLLATAEKGAVSDKSVLADRLSGCSPTRSRGLRRLFPAMARCAYRVTQARPDPGRSLSRVQREHAESDGSAGDRFLRQSPHQDSPALLDLLDANYTSPTPDLGEALRIDVRQPAKTPARDAEPETHIAEVINSGWSDPRSTSSQTDRHHAPTPLVKWIWMSSSARPPPRRPPNAGQFKDDANEEKSQPPKDSAKNWLSTATDVSCAGCHRSKDGSPRLWHGQFRRQSAPLLPTIGRPRHQRRPADRQKCQRVDELKTIVLVAPPERRSPNLVARF